MELIKATFSALCLVLTDTGFLYYVLPFVCAGILGFILLFIKGAVFRV